MNKKMDKIVHNRIFIIALIIILILSTLIFSTYAWFTWSNPSDKNTSLTMSIGRIAEVEFTDGNDINDKLYPVFNYYDGVSTSFSIINYNTNASGAYSINLNITSIDSDLISEHVKYAVVKNAVLVAQGDFGDVTNGSSLTLYMGALQDYALNYDIYLYINGNEENSTDMIGKSIIGNIIVEPLEETSITDFIYYLGSDNPTLTSITKENKTIFFSDVGGEITLEENEILLVDYIGDSSTIVVPNTYTIDGMTYDTTILTGYFNGLDITYLSPFAQKEGLEYIVFNDDVKFLDVEYHFQTHTNFSISENGLGDAFYGCTSMIIAPEIPSSVTTMNSTFYECTSMIIAPEIPSSVTTMISTFYGCTSLNGNIRINSNIVSEGIHIFNNTVNPITVEVPTGSTTYNTFINENLPSNVTIKTY